jgi:hypothetical protein
MSNANDELKQYRKSIQRKKLELHKLHQDFKMLKDEEIDDFKRAADTMLGLRYTYHGSAFII